MRKLHSSTASHVDDKYTKENCIFPPVLTSAYNSFNYFDECAFNSKHVVL